MEKPVPGLIRSDDEVDATDTSPSGVMRTVNRTWTYPSRLVSRDHILSLADQAVVSGTSFLTTILIARFGGAAQLGQYAVGLSLLVSLVAFQDSLILQPYTIQRHSPQGTPAEQAGASFIFSGVFSAGSILLFAIGALGFLQWGDGSEMALVTGAIAGALPFVLMREFARRVAFAHLEVGRALVLDVAVAVLQLSALGWLGLSAHMTAATACAALGAASAVTVAGWLYYTRTEFAIHIQQARTIFKQTWSLGKWLLVGRITVQVQGYATYWITMLIAGSVVTGVYAACMSIVNFANPAIFAISNVVTAKLVLAWKDEGGPGLRQEAIRNTVLIAALMTLFTLAVFFGGERAMQFLYHGQEYEGHGHTLTILALAMFAAALATPASFGLATMGRPRAIVVVTTIGAALSVFLIWLLLAKWGLLGAAYGLLAANVVATAGRWAAFFALIPPESDLTLVTRVLQDFAGHTGYGDCTTTRVGGGEQADVFRIESKRQLPISGEDPTLVVKLYRPGAPLTVEMVEAQFNSLSNLHQAVDGHEVNGWKISAPRPLYVCNSPLALLMTAVPGQYIDACVPQDDVLPSDVLHDGAASAFAAALEQCWSRGQRHGDLGLRNVLFDIEAKTISFIDAGTRESCRTCSEVVRFPSAAASDLAHVLCDVVIDVMDFVGSNARMSREIFVESVLRKIIENIGSQNEKCILLSDIRGCFEEHLVEYLELSSSLKSWIVKHVATNRVRAMLERVESECGSSARPRGYDFQGSVQLR
jgi:O-antigen/teichoic acid export membrane protein